VYRKLGAERHRRGAAEQHRAEALPRLQCRQSSQGTSAFALELLRKNRIDTAGLRSKSWDEFARPGAPALDFVFTVCDNAAGEVCPIWPGQPISAHWGVPDPAAVEGADDVKRRAFFRAYTALSSRINLFLSLPLGKLDRLVLKKKLDEIGRAGGEAKV
jgi:arsenate reductase